MTTGSLKSLGLFIYILIKWICGVWAGEEIVYPQIIEPRGLVMGEKVVQVSSSLTLTLEKSSVLGDKIIVDAVEGSERVRKKIDTRLMRNRLYQNILHMASLLVHETEHGLVVKGMLNGSHSIHPEYRLEKKERRHIAHRIRRIPNFVSPRGSKVKGYPKNDFLEERTDLPSTDEITLPVSVVIDTVHAQECRNEEESVEYVSIMMNAVSLRFQKIPDVNVKFLLREVKILSADIENQWLELTPSKALNASFTLGKLRKRSQDGDLLITGAAIVFLLTGRKSFSRHKTPVNGVAYSAGACGTRKFAVAADVPGTFSGVKVVCHELGHSIGLVHDGNPGKDSDHPGAEGCPSSGCYIMTAHSDCDTKLDRFSSCAAPQIKWFFETYGGLCRKFTASLGPATSPSSNKFPGRRVSAGRFCLLKHPDIEGVWAYMGFKDCLIYCCTPRLLYFFYTYYTYTALDGWPCNQYGDECWHGVCQKPPDRREQQ